MKTSSTILVALFAAAIGVALGAYGYSLLGSARVEHAEHAADKNGRIHDPGVDVARDLEVEQVGAVLRAVERIRHGLVDRHGDGLGGRIGRITAMDCDGFELHLLPLCRA